MVTAERRFHSFGFGTGGGGGVGLGRVGSFLIPLSIGSGGFTKFRTPNMRNRNANLLFSESLRLAERNLESELQLMIAADQRSTTFCGILLATLGVVSSLYNASTNTWYDDLSLIFLGLAAGLSAYSARSVKIFATGRRFQSFEDDLKSGRNADAVLKELALQYDKSSEHNRQVLRSNARFANLSLSLAMFGFALSLCPKMIFLFSKVAESLSFTGGNS